MYRKIFIDLYIKNKYGPDVAHTIELTDIEHPEDNLSVKKAITDIYSYMSNIHGGQFSFIRVGGIFNEPDSEEEELFCVYKDELVENYGVNIIEYMSVWTDDNVYIYN